MVKKRVKTKRKNYKGNSKGYFTQNLSWIIPSFLMLVVIILAVLFLTGVLKIPFLTFLTSPTQLLITDRTIIERLNNFQNPSGVSCSFNFDKSVAFVGEDVIGTIRDGELNSCVVAYQFEGGEWTIYNVEVLDIDGVVSATQSADVPGTYLWTALCGHFDGSDFVPECRTNNKEIEILPLVDDTPDDAVEPGDVLGSGGGNAVLGDDELSTFEINLVAGDYEGDVCAEIERRSSKVDSNCNPVGDLEDWNEFVLKDSYEVVWERQDMLPSGTNVGPDTYGSPDVVNVRWDGSTPFKGFMTHVGTCDMNMEMKVTIKAC